MVEQLHVNYEQYDALIDQVIMQVRQASYKPDLVLGVSRGGLMLADGLSRALRCPMAVIAASSYQGDAGMQQGALQISTSIACCSPVAGQVLLVDDLADSGQTLQALFHHLRGNYPAITSLKTAVLWVKPKSCFQPDFAAQQLQADYWIVQPFEKRDFR